MSSSNMAGEMVQNDDGVEVSQTMEKQCGSEGPFPDRIGHSQDAQAAAKSTSDEVTNEDGGHIDKDSSFYSERRINEAAQLDPGAAMPKHSRLAHCPSRSSPLASSPQRDIDRAIGSLDVERWRNTHDIDRCVKKGLEVCTL